MGNSYGNGMGTAASFSIVSKTLDNMNTISSSLAASESAPIDKQTVGAAVVSKTLDALNADTGSSSASASKDMSQTYQLSKDVLGAYTSGIGSLTDANG